MAVSPHRRTRTQVQSDMMARVIARRRRRRQRSRTALAINLAPMIDVTFLLLIFFLVTTTFEPPEGLLASQMPQDSGKPAVALPISPIVVRITQVGPGPDEYAIALDNFRNVPTNFDQLTAYISEIHRQPGFDQDTPVVIIAGDDVLWDHVVACWNSAVRASCTRIVFGQGSS